MSTWYLGPLGDLRALTCPEPGITVSQVRYGGIHQGLSGARTLDVTGHKAEYTFQWRWIDPAERLWLEALHTRLIPGPFRLIDPLRHNRLSISAVTLNGPGITVPTATRTWTTDWPALAGPGYRSLRLTGWGGETNTVTFDQAVKTAVFPEEQMVGSVWLKADAAVSARIGFEWFDRTGAQVGTNYNTVSITTTWTRFSMFRLAPVGAVSGVFQFRGQTYTTPVQLAAPQFERGSTPAAWETGGGAPVVVLDQLALTSPRFPLVDCDLTLLEA
ncbi:hypothetical protein JOD54_002187 [Actinokineospora baliensis]|uniref:hypothetical protein n=1 Tax=Actinokineospora baliensis TaxID=547056 RepID=UPI00195CB38F|nr:hypothetical protein [Actinokineospora baliensis]MBM7771983.1 hypothetical protein [Actinokineospora baliensis]